ncbi:MAG: DoxX family protein, partial [Prevotella sp.]|nr:DoxX family protein [Prevotella sp.]
MLKQTAVNTCRILLALVFIFSGFVKAIDPMGTVYKLQDYFAATPVDVTSVPMWILIGCAVALSTIEFSLGIFLLFGIHKRLTTRTTLLFMVIMTAITVWIFVKNPVKDCGCFGDAIVLSNGQTLLKNIVLLSCAVIVAVWKDKIVRFITKESQWIVENYTVIFIILISSWCIYDLPLFDFRPYRIGADFRQDMEIPEGEEQPQFETTFLMEKDGKVKEFTIDNYPDSTWTFVDSKTVQTSEGYVPPMHDFIVEDPNTGDDITEETVKSDGFTFLLIAPDLASANDGSFGDIERIYEYSIDNKYPFYCLTASDKRAQENWREKTGAEYNFFFADHTTLKTVTRSNPGLLLLK